MQSSKTHRFEISDRWGAYDLVWEVAYLYPGLAETIRPASAIAPMIKLAKNVDDIYGRLTQVGVFFYIAEKTHEQLLLTRRVMAELEAVQHLAKFNECISALARMGFGGEKNIDRDRVGSAIGDVSSPVHAALSAFDDNIDGDEGYRLYNNKFSTWARTWNDEQTGKRWAGSA